MVCRLASVKVIVGLCFGGILMFSSACVYLATLPIQAVVGGAELAWKGGDVYKEMKKADERRAFDLPFEMTWETVLFVLQDLQMKPAKAAKNKEGDGGVFEVRAHETRIRIAVVKISERVSEVGIWAKKDKALGDLLMKKIADGTRVRVGVGEAVLPPSEEVCPMGRNLQSTRGLMMK